VGSSSRIAFRVAEVRWSPGQGPLDLAILSFVAYPGPVLSYELLGDLRRAVNIGRAAENPPCGPTAIEERRSGLAAFSTA
jgi:hypothetical protein